MVIILLTFCYYQTMLKLFNTKTKSKETFTPITPGKVKMYHCGPTVYDHVHIGNLRSFILADTIRRVMEYLGYEVTQVINITDVGHLISDGDTGQDKMTKALLRENLPITTENMLKIANKYTESFLKNIADLNITPPHHLPKASEHIQENIELIQILENKGYTYTTSDGIYFDTEKMPNYGELDNLKTTNSQHVENTEKKNPADFALWKFDENNGWPSPWGQGFPGWHIECSSMSYKYLGDHFDIHTGGQDLARTHHNNEIAQSTCAFNTNFVNYWLHNEFVILKNSKMSKSAGTGLTLFSLKNEGFNPLSYRYLLLQTHYRSPLDFSKDSLTAAQNGLNNLKQQVSRFGEIPVSPPLLSETAKQIKDQFISALEDDLNTAKALSILQTLIKNDNLKNEEKVQLIIDFDTVLGLNLAPTIHNQTIPEEINSLKQKRDIARKEKNWQKSDELRQLIETAGYIVEDHENGSQVIPKIK